MRTFAHPSILVSRRLMKACSLEYIYTSERHKYTNIGYIKTGTGRSILKTQYIKHTETRHEHIDG